MTTPPLDADAASPIDALAGYEPPDRPSQTMTDFNEILALLGPDRRLTIQQDADPALAIVRVEEMQNPRRAAECVVSLEAVAHANLDVVAYSVGKCITKIRELRPGMTPDLERKLNERL